MIKLNKKQEYSLYAIVGILVLVAVIENQNIQASNPVYFAKPLSADEMKQYANVDPKAVVIYPILTQIAYTPGGFYPQQKNESYPQFTTVSMLPLGINASYTSSINSFKVLQELHYPVITDIDVDQHPEILKYYDKIILLHNEYMTKKEFDAIMAHNNVIYLYPNAAYAEVSIDYNKWQMTLIRGHGYKGIDNGFDFSTSSKNEYNLNCVNWKWEKMPNGMETTCWPEFLILEDRNMIKQINDYPYIIPPLMSYDDPNFAPIKPSSLPDCTFYGFCGSLHGNGIDNESSKN